MPPRTLLLFAASSTGSIRNICLDAALLHFHARATRPENQNHPRATTIDFCLDGDPVESLSLLLHRAIPSGSLVPPLIII